MAVCIAGMHRSGTSMVTRLLNLCGLDLGPQGDLNPARPDNPEGFWENLRFMSLNDRLLEALGGGWDVVPAFPPDWQGSTALSALRQEAAVLVGSFEREPWGWKDPRNSILLDFWLSVLPEMRVVICLRNPLDVAESLHKRGASSLGFGLDLWYRYNRRMVELIPPGRRVVSHYDAYFSDPVRELKRVLGALQMSASEEAVASAVKAAKLSLRHAQTDFAALEHASSRGEIAALYAHLLLEAGDVAAGLAADGGRVHAAAAAAPLEGLPRAASSGGGDSAATAMLSLQYSRVQTQLDQLSRTVQQVAEVLPRERALREQYNAIVASPTWRIVSRVGAAAIRLGLYKPADAATVKPRGLDEQGDDWGCSSLETPQLSNSPIYLLQQVRHVWKHGGARAVWSAYQRRREIRSASRRTRAGEARPAAREAGGEVADAVLRAAERAAARGNGRAVVMDWDSGLDLGKLLPRQCVFSPIGRGSCLPFLDGTVDLVVLREGDAGRYREARRIARGAVGVLEGDRLRVDAIAPAGKPAVRVSIIIPVYNGWATTKACLDSIHATLPADFAGEILVMDDNSTDETAREMAGYCRAHPLVQHLRNEKNLGFLGNCNRAAREASGEMLVLVNNDTLARKDWLTPLLRTFERFPEAGVVGGKLVYPDGRLQEAGGVIFNDGSGANFGKGDPNPAAPLYNFVREVDYCSGALLATPRGLFLDLGGFDAAFAPAYYEDTDYCFRVRARGRAIYYQPASELVHLEGYSCGTDVGSGIKKHQALNRQTFIGRWKAQLQLAPPPPADFRLETWYTLAMGRGGR